MAASTIAAPAYAASGPGGGGDGGGGGGAVSFQLSGGKSSAPCSGGAFVDAVESIQHLA